jgi:branched-chain amino acid aminotransferase
VIVWLNGRFLPADQASVPIADRGFLHADGVFETALLHRGGFFRLAEHLERFAASAATMRIVAPAPAELDATIRELARRNGMRDGSLRLTLTRGVREPTLLITLAPPDPAHRERASRGWRLVTARTRRPSVASAPAQLKALGRTYAILARLEAADAAVDDALLLTDKGHVCEGPAWNVFWRIGQSLYTPDGAAGVLPGVTRGAILRLAPPAGFDVREGLFPREELDAADEVFATMTSVGIVRILALDGRTLPAQTPAADLLQPRYLELLEAEAAADPV